MVSRKRTLLARKLSMASETTSLNIMVLRALARVESNDFVSGAGLGTLVVAIGLTRQDWRAGGRAASSLRSH
jgi:hypothetical protein